MDILIQLDGLLWRFGDVVPDAIAMLHDIRIIESRLSGRDDQRSIRAKLFRAPGDREIPSGDKAARLADLLELSPSELEDVPAFGSLNPDTSDVVLTTSHGVARQCRAKDIWAIRVSDQPSDRDIAMSFVDVMRGLEERLRIPTARPMRAAVREGGLLALKCDSADAAFDTALDAIRDDRHADWVIVDNVLLLYTENPDLDDALGELPHAERLSYGVNKLALVLEENGMPGTQDALMDIGNIRLRDLQSEATGGDGGGQLLTWNEARRQRLGPSREEVPEARGKIEPLVLHDAYIEHASSALHEETMCPDSMMRQIIADILEVNVTADTIAGPDGPLALTWRTDSGRRADSGISVWVYRGELRADAQYAAALSGIAQISRWIAPQADRRHIVHCLLMDSEPTIENVLQDLLFTDERHRVASVVEFGGLTNADDRVHITGEAPADSRPTVIRIDGGRWCQAPYDPEQTGAVQAALIDAVFAP